jgi:3'(2'), 5'-bisphosphate nucleotidase
LIDPIDGTKEYISGKDEYTLNASLIIEKKPIIGLVGVPKKKQLFYSYGIGKSFVKQNDIEEKINCKKKNKRNKIVAVSSTNKPSEVIMKKLTEYKVSSIVQVASSYKFCLIADGTFDIYAARERANEWDYAAGHAIAENAGAIITTLDNKPFLYGKEDYKNPSLLMLRSKNLND